MKRKEPQEKRSVGKPRIHDRDQIFSNLIEWAKQPDSINFNKFCAHCDPPISAPMLLVWVRENPQYRQAYETAKSFLGYRREEKLNKNELHVKAYDLNATNYDLFLRDERRLEAEFQAQLSKEIKNNLSDDDKMRYEELLEQIKRFQSAKIAPVGTLNASN